MSFFAFAADHIGKVVVSLGTRSLGETLKDVRTGRRMERLVQDAVDRIVEQMDSYLQAEKLSDPKRETIILALCAKLQPLADDPQRFFVGDLDGVRIFDQCHPKGELPEEIREEGLAQFYTVLFPQVAHFIAGSRIALTQWQAEGFREEFKRLTQLAEQLRTMNAKVAEIPEAVVSAVTDRASQAAEILLRELAQTILNNVLLRLDLSPLRAERALHGSLGDHFVIPALQERREDPYPLDNEKDILNALVAPGARRILYGGAGVGKTTCSTWLQSKLLQASPARLAVVLRLREFVDVERRSLLDIVRERAGVHLRDAITDEVLRTWQELGRLVIILDGLDEVPEERRDAVERWVKDLDAVAKKTAILVTSRPLESGHFSELPTSWQWDVLPFDRTRIIEFIERWHRYLPEGELSASERKVDTHELANIFWADPSLKALADTPLMLGTLLFVHHRDKKLPSGRVDLYERYISAMLGLRDSGLGIQARATKLTDRDKRRVLAYVALHFHVTGINEVNDETMSRLVAEALVKFRLDEEASRLLPALRERTGLVQGPGAWSFTHKTIGEFLVAELICEGTTRLPDNHRLDRKELWNNRHKDAWTAVLFFWAGKTTPHELEEFVSDLINQNEEADTLLAFSLMHDQGDRIEHEAMRSLTLRLLQKDLPSGIAVKAVFSMPPVPASVYEEMRVETVELKSLLRNADVVDAVARFLGQGYLTLDDISLNRADLREVAIVAAFNSLSMHGTCMTLDMRHKVEHLSPRSVALFSFGSYVKSADTINTAQRVLTEWIGAFPENRPLVPLLLAASIVEDHELRHRPGVSRFQQRIWQELWEWRNEPVAEDWLRESDVCRQWNVSLLDLLQKIREIMEGASLVSIGVNANQYSDLLEWNNRLLAERRKLKLSKSLAK